MLTFRWIATALFIVAVPVFLLLTNVRVAAVEPRVYRYSFTQYDAVASTGIDRAQLDRAADEIARYFGNAEPLLAIRVQVDGRDESLFNPRETLHMRDVKVLFRRVFRLHEIAFVYVVGYIAAVFLWSRERSRRRLAQQFVAAGLLTAGLLVGATAAVLVGFDDLFRQFHLLSFSNDFWLLDPRTDHLIQMFPSDFWFDVTFAVGAVTLLEGAVLALAGFGYLRWLARAASRRERQATAAAASARMGG